jgi:prepilin-type N-terminal cleavage/methylation domain-containing protein
MRRSPGFTLVELAVVLLIVGLLLLSLLYTLSAQTDQRDFEETRRRLEQARELVLAFAIMNGRLPCPARSTSAGAEVRNAAGECKDAANVEDYYGGSLAGGVTAGLLPAATIGMQVTDAAGFAIDAWQNRIRYAVAKSVANCSGAFTNPHWVNAANMKANGITCQPSDLLVCKSATGITPMACGGAANQIMSQNLVVAIVFSTGKNGATGAAGADEAANLNGAGNADPIFVFHTPTPAGAANGVFDDQFVWITAGEFYGKLVAAGVLP